MTFATYTRCPHCQQSFELPERPLYVAGDWQQAEWRQFAAGASELAGVGELMRETPTRPADPLADVAVPLLQAAICGAAAAMLAAIWLDLRGVLIAGVVGFGLAWLFLLRGSLSRLVIREHVVKQPEGEAPAPYITRLAFSIDGYQQQTELQLPADKILAIAKGTIGANRPFSEAEWSGKGRLLSGRREYHLLRDTFIRLGWARWKDENAHAQGVEWTPAGRSALKALASGRVKAEQLLD